MSQPGQSGLLALMFAAFLLWTPAALSIDVSASIEKAEIAFDEHVELVLEARGEPSSGPDLSVLEGDFEILDRRSQRSLSVINGQRSERNSLTLTLLPRRSGLIEIPPIYFGNVATEPLNLKVAEGPAAGDQEPDTRVLLEATAEPSQTYVKQQLVLTAKVLMPVHVQRPHLHDPRIPNVKILPLGEDRYKSQRDGRSYTVYERRYAIFPEHAGQLAIEPLLFEGWSGTGPQADSGLTPRAGPVRARSTAVSVEVLPIPAGTEPDRWLPAQKVTLTESGPQTYQVQAGQSIERRITLRVDGVMASVLPALAVQVPYQLTKSGQAPRLSDERRPQGVVGTRQEVISLTASEPGLYQLPPLSLDWWNTAKGQWQTAMLPARELVVAAADAASGAPAAPTTATQGRWATPEDSQPSAPLATPTEPIASTQPDSSNRPGVWIWITLALGAIWLATLIAWWWSKRRRTPPAAPEPAVPGPEPVAIQEDPHANAIAAVRAAYQAGNAAAAREALLDWARQVLPDHVPSNLARLAQRCPEPLRGQILLLEEAFFSPRPVPWDKQPVWEQLLSFAPKPLEEPASFRRGKPLRRRTPSPNPS